MHKDLPEEMLSGLAGGALIPYLGSGMLALTPGGTPVPATPEALAAAIHCQGVRAAQDPHAPYRRGAIHRNFKHRKTIVAFMSDSFAPAVTPSPLLCALAGLPRLPLLVDTWYDNACQAALAQRAHWGQVQGLSQSEHFGQWLGYYDGAGRPVDAAVAATWETLLYKPIGGVSPARNYLVSDSDLCGSPDRNRHPYPDPAARQRAAHRARLPVPGLPLHGPCSAPSRARS